MTDDDLEEWRLTALEHQIAEERKSRKAGDEALEARFNKVLWLLVTFAFTTAGLAIAFAFNIIGSAS